MPYEPVPSKRRPRKRPRREYQIFQYVHGEQHDEREPAPKTNPGPKKR